jgi:hypothetical protein
MNYSAELLSLLPIKDVRATLVRTPGLKWDRRDAAALQGICFHQSLDDVSTVPGLAKYFAGPNHISDKGLPGISYTLVCEQSGDLFLVNDIEDKTFSQGDASKPGDENVLYMGICFCGNFSGPGYQGTQEPTTAQMNTAERIWQTCKGLWGWKNNQLFGHYHFGKPACPGFTLTHFIETINADKDWKDPKYDLSETEGRQGALNELGYWGGPIDGNWGPECRLALTQFQKKAGLQADGVWGPKTNAAVVTALG